MRKSAATVDTLKNILTGLGIGAGVSAGVAGIGYLMDKRQEHNRNVQLPIYFSQMLMKNPDINELYLRSDKDRQDVEDLFKLLEDFAPKIVENPLAAGTFIRQYKKYGDMGTTTEAVKALSDINKNYAGDKGGYSGMVINKAFENSVSNVFKGDQ